MDVCLHPANRNLANLSVSISPGIGDQIKLLYWGRTMKKYGVTEYTLQHQRNRKNPAVFGIVVTFSTTKAVDHDKTV